ncbi:MAG: septum formation protein Maf [Phycisphaerae bacterium]|nr:septum formation protein Maf [Phycisphaerae bacterium]
MSISTAEIARELVLASASPRRAQLLREAGYAFTVVEPPIPEPETLPKSVTAAQAAEALSYFKACAVADIVRGGWILAADTIVAHGDEMFGKPADQADARRILTRLMNTTHQVITGVTLLDTAGRHRIISHDVTRVTMRRLTSDELDEYLAGGAWEGKAGAYGIQDHHDPFVESIEGSFSNVVGLPMELLCRMFASAT